MDYQKYTYLTKATLRFISESGITNVVIVADF